MVTSYHIQVAKIKASPLVGAVTAKTVWSRCLDEEITLLGLRVRITLNLEKQHCSQGPKHSPHESD